jgi:hypothetical protein
MEVGRHQVTESDEDDFLLWAYAVARRMHRFNRSRGLSERPLHITCRNTGR